MNTHPSLFDRVVVSGHTLAGAPFSNPTTSKEAARSMDDQLPRLERVVLLAIRSRGKNGLTCDEAEQYTELPHTTCSARINALAKPERRLIVKSGEKRKTRSGRRADVYVTPEFAR